MVLRPNWPATLMNISSVTGYPATIFDGVTDVLTRNTNLGITLAECEQYVFACYFRNTRSAPGFNRLLSTSTSTGGLDIYIDNSNPQTKVNIVAQDAAGTNINYIRNASNVLNIGQTYAVLGSANMLTGTTSLVYNNISSISTITNTFPTVAGWSTATQFRVAGSATTWPGGIGMMYFRAGTYADAATNFSNFFNADFTPKDLGANGSTPLGVVPQIYMNGFDFVTGTNRGSGGAFTVTGSPRAGRI